MLPTNLPSPTPPSRASGYYRVRKGHRWFVARWSPARHHWALNRGDIVPQDGWDEVAEKVA